MAESKKRKSAPTRELVLEVLRKLDRQDSRLKSIETRQTLSESAWQRQGQVIEVINQRCLEKLGLKCPLLDNGENSDNDIDNEDGNVISG